MVDFVGADIYIDMCVQREYLAPSSPTRCANSELVGKNVRHLMAFARMSNVPVLSCVDSHRPHDIGDNFVAIRGGGSPQERMLPGTVLPKHVVVESDNCLNMPLDILQRAQQAIFTKVHKDPFTHPKLDRLLTELPARRLIVFGVPLETSVRLLVLGLILRGRRVVLVRDACGYFDESGAMMTCRQLEVKGAEVMSAEAYVGSAVMLMSQRRNRRRRREVA